jgi:hypothetical protein
MLRMLVGRSIRARIWSAEIENPQNTAANQCYHLPTVKLLSEGSDERDEADIRLELTPFWLNSTFEPSKEEVEAIETSTGRNSLCNQTVERVKVFKSLSI